MAALYYLQFRGGHALSLSVSISLSLGRKTLRIFLKTLCVQRLEIHTILGDIVARVSPKVDVKHAVYLNSMVHALVDGDRADYNALLTAVRRYG